jgi:hypothetical protein
MILRLLPVLICALIISGCVQPHPSESTQSDPVIKKLTADPPVIQVGSSCTLTVEAEDPGGGPLTYQWSASAGDIIGQGASVRYTASFCCTGSNRVKVTVKNNRGGSASQSIDVYVN